MLNPTHSLTPSSAFSHCMALNGLLCADVPLRIYTLISDAAALSYCTFRLFCHCSSTPNIFVHLISSIFTNFVNTVLAAIPTGELCMFGKSHCFRTSRLLWSLRLQLALLLVSCLDASCCPLSPPLGVFWQGFTILATSHCFSNFQSMPVGWTVVKQKCHKRKMVFHPW